MPRWARSVHNSAACETCDFVRTENCDAKRLRPICRSSANIGGLFLIWPRGVWGSGGGFSSAGPSAEGSWEGLGFGNRRRRFPAGLSRFLQTRGCVKQKSLQRPPSIRFSDSVILNLGLWEALSLVEYVDGDEDKENYYSYR